MIPVRGRYRERHWGRGALLVTLLLIFYLFPFDAASGRLTEVEIFQAFGHPALVTPLPRSSSR